MKKHFNNRPIFLSLFLLLIFNCGIAQSPNIITKIKTILQNVNAYNDTFVLITGKVSDLKRDAVQIGFVNLPEFTLTDRSGSINVFGMAYTIKNNDSITVIGKFRKERKIGQFAVGENELDASNGQITVLESLYLDQQVKQDSIDAAQLELQLNQPESTDPLDNSVPTHIVDTPSSRMVTYATILGSLFTILTFIPLLLRRRRFNIDLKIVSLAPATIVRGVLVNEKFICVNLKLYNLKQLPPDINSHIVCQMGNANLTVIKATSDDNSEIKFPILVERSISINLYFNYEDSIQLFSNSDKFIIKLKDEFCGKIFTGRFNYNIVLQEDEVV